MGIYTIFTLYIPIYHIPLPVYFVYRLQTDVLFSGDKGIRVLKMQLTPVFRQRVNDFGMIKNSVNALCSGFPVIAYRL
jgi:hypothetical protein